MYSCVSGHPNGATHGVSDQDDPGSESGILIRIRPGKEMIARKKLENSGQGDMNPVPLP
jgi:hypothetical protein